MFALNFYLFYMNLRVVSVNFCFVLLFSKKAMREDFGIGGGAIWSVNYP